MTLSAGGDVHIHTDRHRKGTPSHIVILSKVPAGCEDCLPPVVCTGRQKAKVLNIDTSTLRCPVNGIRP